MGIAGLLETFSLPELLRVINSGSKSGRLLIQPQSSLGISTQVSTSLWFRQGRFITVTSPTKSNLSALIRNQGWLTKRNSTQIEKCPQSVPLGTYLEKQKILKTKQIQDLFQMQLVQVFRLFELTSGRFEFESIKQQNGSWLLPWEEMTGLSLQTIEVALFALRRLPNWSHLTEQLPESGAALKSLVNHPRFQLDSLESQLWVLSDGKTPLKIMTRQVDGSLEAVQRAAFRLMLAGLVDEVPFASTSSLVNASLPSLRNVRSSKPEPVQASAATLKKSGSTVPAVSTSLLKNIINFLRRF